jgi:hypothetical protein
MKDFFAPIYELLKAFYGSDLADHLYGLDPSGTGDYSARSLYVTVGFLCIIITVFTVAAYYFIINSPRFNRWFHWLGFMGAVFFINLGLGFYLPYLDFDKGNVAPAVRDVVSAGHLWGFGLANALWSVVLFAILSILAKRFSRNCSTVPF